MGTQGHGIIIELGPDGYGYIADSAAPGKSYSFSVDQIVGCALPSDFTRCEEAAVTFSLSSSGKIEEVRICELSAIS